MNQFKIDSFIAAAKKLPWENREFYAQFMAQIYFLTTHSVQMLNAAASVTDRPDYARHLIQMIKLEIGHDKVALSDLKALGRTPDEFSEFGITRSIWESQLYKIQRCPDALTGYIFALEKSAVEVYGHILKTVTEAHGASAVRFMKLHAEEDQDHVVKAMEQIEALDLKSRVEAMINAEQACAMLGHLFDEVIVLTQSKSRAA